MESIKRFIDSNGEIDYKLVDGNISTITSIEALDILKYELNLSRKQSDKFLQREKSKNIRLYYYFLLSLGMNVFMIVSYLLNK